MGFRARVWWYRGMVLMGFMVVGLVLGTGMGVQRDIEVGIRWGLGVIYMRVDIWWVPMGYWCEHGDGCRRGGRYGVDDRY